MKTLFICSLLSATVLLTSCASIFTKTSYPVNIYSNPDGANIKITDKNGKDVYSGKTPSLVDLKASNKYMSGEKYTVTISKDGFEDQTIYLTSKIEGWYWGNILFGGLIGMLIVDPLTGAMYKLNTSLINASLEKTNKDGTLSVVDYNSLDDKTKEMLVKIN